MLWKNRQFWWLWGISGFLEMTKLLCFVVVPLWMFHVTQSATMVALVPVADMTAVVLTGSVGGRWADRWPRTLLLVSVGGTIGLTLIALGTASVLGGWSLLALTFGLYGGLRLASFGRTVLTNRVFRHQLVEMNSAVGLIHSVAKVAGPLLGGTGFLVLGIRGALMMAVMAQAIVWVVTARLPRPVETGESRVPAAAPPTTGWAHLRRNVALRQGVAYFSLYMLSGSVYSSLFYLFLLRVVHAPTAWYPLAMALEGLGNVGIAGWVPRINRQWPVARIMVWATLGMAIPNVALFVWPHLWLVLVVNPVVGMATQVAMVTVRAHYQQHSEALMVGQMLGLRSAIANLVAIGGSLAAAGLVSRLSPQPILLGSMTCLMAGAAVSVRFAPEARSASEPGAVRSP